MRPAKLFQKRPVLERSLLGPQNFHLITPKLVVKEGAKLKAGDVIFYSKTEEKIKFVSPVSGAIFKKLKEVQKELSQR